jgi:hypothetical protein
MAKYVIPDAMQQSPAQKGTWRVLGTVGAATLGFGGLAALMTSLRRKNERRLMDEQRAKASLSVPVYSDMPLGKHASVGSVLKGVGTWGLPAAGITAGAGLAGYGLAKDPVIDAQGNREANVVRRAIHTGGKALSYAPGMDKAKGYLGQE